MVTKWNSAPHLKNSWSTLQKIRYLSTTLHPPQVNQCSWAKSIAKLSFSQLTPWPQTNPISLNEQAEDKHFLVLWITTKSVAVPICVESQPWQSHMLFCPQLSAHLNQRVIDCNKPISAILDVYPKPGTATWKLLEIHALKI